MSIFLSYSIFLILFLAVTITLFWGLQAMNLM
uniref:Cytochrome b6-f complex subunit VI n=1 Tax=Hildenbrandia rubra TaxID=31481 RepID=A0A1C9CFX7_9FLOR|nr:cytochrome b6-f complex subunit VI [Hildenbrandia rubra]AOM67298.1 cytochrome b6-f complex subunit VI [Hildenbrandia rubra]